jgi:hypothetical protein
MLCPTFNGRFVPFADMPAARHCEVCTRLNMKDSAGVASKSYD